MEDERIENRGDYEGEASAALQAPSETLPATEFVKVEKNLASLGFFTPSSKRLRNAQEKSFTVTTVADGQRLELKGTIIPSAKYGLPITADQDKWIALCKILTDILRKEGRVTNPISFTSADILRLLHQHRHSGKNYREVEEWLDVLFSTTIFSEGIVYLANEKRRVKDRFRVFERAVSFGKELSDGKVADKNYVWLSEWQLQNINSNHLLPIDLEAYRELRNHIAKALVPLLQIWLYATRAEGIFEKRYDELCQMLNIRQYAYPSLITRILAPSLDELKQFGYLADWRIEKTRDGENYKIVFYHGEKFHRDRRARLNRKQLSKNTDPRKPELGEVGAAQPSQAERRSLAASASAKPVPGIDETFLKELMKRGVTEVHARKILSEIHTDQPVIAQLEWGDLQVQRSGGKIANPGGFYISLVSGNVIPPPTFEASVQRKAREEAERRLEAERRERQELETEYEWYREGEIDRYIATLDPAEVASVLDAKRQENRERYQTPWMVDQFAEQDAKRELGKRAPLMTLEEFKMNRRPASDSFPKPVPEMPTAGIVAAEPESAHLPLESGPDEPAEATPSDLIPPGEGGEEAIDKPPAPAAPSPVPQPVIELASEPFEPRPDSGDPPAYAG